MMVFCFDNSPSLGSVEFLTNFDKFRRLKIDWYLTRTSPTFRYDGLRSLNNTGITYPSGVVTDSNSPKFLTFRKSNFKATKVVKVRFHVIRFVVTFEIFNVRNVKFFKLILKTKKRSIFDNKFSELILKNFTALEMLESEPKVWVF